MATFLVGTVCVIALVLAVMTVNAFYRLLMKITGSSAIFYSIKKKLIAYFLVWAMYVGLLGSVFGLG